MTEETTTINLDKLRSMTETWKIHTKTDRVGATLKFAEALEGISLKENLIWPHGRDFPPFLVPKDQPNAELINAILMKSMETQASSVLGYDQCLSQQNCFIIHGLLAYYFKQIPSKIIFTRTYILH